MVHLPAHSDFGLTWCPVSHGVLRFGDPESKFLRLLLVFRAFENHVGAYVGLAPTAPPVRVMNNASICIQYLIIPTLYFAGIGNWHVCQ